MRPYAGVSRDDGRKCIDGTHRGPDPPLVPSSPGPPWAAVRSFELQLHGPHPHPRQLAGILPMLRLRYNERPNQFEGWVVDKMADRHLTDRIAI